MSATPDDILGEVQRILTQELGASQPLAPDDELAGFAELDSIGLITLAVGLEDRFRVRLTGADARDVVTARDLVDLVGRRLAGDGR